MTDEEVFGETEGVDDEPIDEEALLIQEEIKECFEVFDQKMKGSIPSGHLKKALKSLGIGLTSVELDDLLEKYDKDGKPAAWGGLRTRVLFGNLNRICDPAGVIEYADFFEMATEKIKEIEPALHLKKAFEVFDPDGEGAIPTERFKKWMTTLGNPLTESEAKELCRMGDPNNKGIFMYDDVINMLIY